MIRFHLLKKEVLEKMKDRTAVQKAEWEELEKRIKKASEKWLTSAIERTDYFRLQGKYSETLYKPNWSSIKKVYMKLQANKCAYCEQKLEDRGIQHDVEHFRPKNSVKAWLNEKQKKKLKKEGFDVTLPLGPDSDGYHLLPYRIFNYITACKVCNTNLKSNYFPIKDNRLLKVEDFNDLLNEGPYLPYPLGHFDTDAPEELISFEGHIPIVNPNLTDAHKINRARVSIVFFELDIRPYLLQQRAEVIKKVFEAFNDSLTHHDAARRSRAKKDLARWVLPSSEHANCAQSFHGFCESDPKKAFMLYEKACNYIDRTAQLDS